MIKTESLMKQKIYIKYIYINTMMPHGHHICAKSSDMSNAKTCAQPQYDHASPHWKYVLQYCAKFSCVNIPEQEADDQYSNTRPSISFHIYHIISNCTTHGSIPLKNNKICRVRCSASEQSTKIYSRKYLLMIVTTISNFYTIFFIPEIQRLAFHIPHVRILGTNHCGDSRQLRLNSVNHFKMCCVSVIMLRGKLLVLPIKYNHNTKVEIDPCLLRALYWNIPVN